MVSPQKERAGRASLWAGEFWREDATIAAGGSLAFRGFSPRNQRIRAKEKRWGSFKQPSLELIQISNTLFRPVGAGGQVPQTERPGGRRAVGHLQRRVQA